MSSPFVFSLDTSTNSFPLSVNVACSGNSQFGYSPDTFGADYDHSGPPTTTETILARYQRNVIAQGQSAVSGGQLTAITTMLDAIASIRGGTGLTLLKELHLPLRDASTAQVRLVYKGANKLATFDDFSAVTGALGTCTSSIVNLTDIDYDNFSFGTMLASVGFRGSPNFTVLFGGNGDNFNFTTYDWAGAYDKVVGPSMVFGPNLGVGNTGDSMLYNPGYGGFLTVSGSADEHFVSREGNVLFYIDAPVRGTSMDATALYLPFTSLTRWFASFVAESLTQDEMQELVYAIRPAVEVLGYSNVPDRPANRCVLVGDSRTWSTDVTTHPYAETFYKQLADAMGWDEDNAEVLDYGINGKKMSQFAGEGNAFPNKASVFAFGRSRSDVDPFAERLLIVWLGANDFLTGATVANTKLALDAFLTEARANHLVPIVIGEPATYGSSRPEFDAILTDWNATLAADTDLTDGTLAYGYLPIDTLVDMDDPDDSFDGVHLTPVGYGKIITDLAPLVTTVIS